MRVRAALVAKQLGVAFEHQPAVDRKGRYGARQRGLRELRAGRGPQLRLVDVATGQARWLTDDEWRWATPRWSPLGDRLAAVVAGDPDDKIGGQCLRLVDLDGAVTSTDIPCGRAVVPVWLADGRLVALVVEPQGRPGGSERAGAGGFFAGRANEYLRRHLGGVRMSDSHPNNEDQGPRTKD